MKNYFYYESSDVRGGSKISLLNNILLLHSLKQDICVIVSAEDWFSDILKVKGIKYKVFKEAKYLKYINNSTPLYKVFLILLFCSPKILFNQLRIISLIKKQNKGTKFRIIINDVRDSMLFLPYILYSGKSENILWLRGEKIDNITSLIVKKMDKIIAVTNVVKNNFIDKFPAYKGSVSVIYNFLYENPDKYRKNLLEKNIINIGLVGTIQPIKGQLDAAKVLKKLTESGYNVKLHIVGSVISEPYWDKTLKYLKENKLDEKMIYWNNQEKILDVIYSNFDILMMPSQTESFGRVAMEASSVGIPTIAYEVGGLKEVIENNVSGKLSPKNDIDSLVDNIKKIFDNTDNYQRLCENARENWEEKFSLKAVKKEFIKSFLS